MSDMLDRAARDAVADRIIEHLAFHSAYRPLPAGYQFLLPNGSLLTADDGILNGRRSLMLWSTRGIIKIRQGVGIVQREKKADHDAPWGRPDASEKEQKRLRTILRGAVEVAHPNHDYEITPGNLLVDPSKPPVRADG